MSNYFKNWQEYFDYIKVKDANEAKQDGSALYLDNQVIEDGYLDTNEGRYFYVGNFGSFQDAFNKWIDEWMDFIVEYDASKSVADMIYHYEKNGELYPDLYALEDLFNNTLTVIGNDYFYYNEVL